MFSLTRIEPADGAGISGAMLMRTARLVDGEVEETEGLPVVDSVLLLDSLTQWYRTSQITEIVSKTDEEMVFKTLNSKYKLTIH